MLESRCVYFRILYFRKTLFQEKYLNLSVYVHLLILSTQAKKKKNILSQLLNSSSLLYRKISIWNTTILVRYIWCYSSSCLQNFLKCVVNQTSNFIHKKCIQCVWDTRNLLQIQTVNNCVSVIKRILDS